MRVAARQQRREQRDTRVPVGLWWERWLRMETHDHGAQRLRPPRERLDPRAITWWRAHGALTAAPWIVASLVAAPLLPAVVAWEVLLPAAAVVLLLVRTLVIPAWRYRIHRWEVTDEAVYAASGWWIQQWRIAPLSRIQTVDTVRGPLQRRFGLSTLTVTTASAAGPIEIAGLDHAVAERLVEHLTTVTQATTGDAT